MTATAKVFTNGNSQAIRWPKAFRVDVDEMWIARNEVTGEITLRGRVLPIGGLKEKLLAALRAGIKTVMIPEENVKDLTEIPENVKKGLEIIPVALMDDVLKHALTRMPEPITWDEAAEEAAAAARAAAERSGESAARAH